MSPRFPRPTRTGRRPPSGAARPFAAPAGAGRCVVVEVSEGAAPDGWDDAIRALRPVVFHGSGWADYKCSERYGEPLYVTWRSQPDGTVVGRALAIRRRHENALLGRVAARLVFDSPPVRSGPGGNLIAPLAVWARRRWALTEVSLGSFDAQDPWTSGGMPQPRARLEYVVPPVASEEPGQGLRRLARRKIKRASGSGLEAQLRNELDVLQDFAGIYRITEERLLREKHVPTSNIESSRLARALHGLVQGGGSQVV